MRAPRPAPSFVTAAFCAGAAICSAGCSDAEAPFERTGEVALADTVCASGETLEGIDVSKWQAGIDWAAVKNSGISFAIARASYGTSPDEYFDANWSEMKSVGLVRGAYQYFLPDEDAIAQADFMIAAMGDLGPGDLPPVIDVESAFGQSAATIESKVGQWLAHVEAATGRKPMIYTGKYFWQDYVGGSDAFVDYPLWIPNYSFDCPNLPNGSWPDWAMFQYTDSGSVPGVSGNVDRDLFNGTAAELLAFANGGFAAEFVSQSFPFASQPPLQIEAGETLDVVIEMKNVGSRQWTSNTRLATTQPRDRVSVFAGPEWPASNRYAQVEGVVNPGETYKFAFTLHAPAEVGVYDEFFGLVHEGEAWFSDPGHGGPPDDQLEGIFEVVPNPGTGATTSGNGSGSGTGSGSASGGSTSAGGTGGGVGGSSVVSDEDPAIGDEGGCSAAPVRGGGWTWQLTALAAIAGMIARGRRRFRG